jgi:hypothetical protein
VVKFKVRQGEIDSSLLTFFIDSKEEAYPSLWGKLISKYLVRIKLYQMFKLAVVKDSLRQD